MICQCGAPMKKRWHTRNIVQRHEWVCPQCGLIKQPIQRGQQRGQWYQRPRPEVEKE